MCGSKDQSRLELASDTHNPTPYRIFDSQQDKDQDYSEARSPKQWFSEFHTEEARSSDMQCVLSNCLAQYNNLCFPRYFSSKGILVGEVGKSITIMLQITQYAVCQIL